MSARDDYPTLNGWSDHWTEEDDAPRALFDEAARALDELDRQRALLAKMADVLRSHTSSTYGDDYPEEYPNDDVLGVLDEYNKLGPMVITPDVAGYAEYLKARIAKHEELAAAEEPYSMRHGDRLRELALLQAALGAVTV